MKRCGHCLRFLPNYDFWRRGDGNGLAAWCKTCTHHAAKTLPPMQINHAPLAQALNHWRS